MTTESPCSHLKRAYARATKARLMAGINIWRVGSVVTAISARNGGKAGEAVADDGVSFSVAIGSYTVLAASVPGHAVLIAAAAVTAATFTVAAQRPKLFMRGASRRRDGDHD